MTIPELQNEIIAYFQNESWSIQVFIVVFLTLLIRFFQKRIFLKLIRKLKHTRTLWDEALLGALSKPLGLLIWILGLAFAADIIKANNEPSILFNIVDPARRIGVIICIAWFLSRFIKRAERNLIQKYANTDKALDVTTADAIAKLLRASVFITAALIIIQVLGYSISGVLAFGGIGGIAIGFAAKDLLANFFGGLMIYLDRPFNVGDWIYSPDQEMEGVVENIGWRLTTIRTFDKRPVYLPNSIFTTIAVVNPSRMSHRRIYETVGIRYDDADKLEAIVADIKEMVKNHDEIDNRQAILVNFNKFAASSLDIMVYCLTKTTNWFRYHDVKQDVMVKIMQIIESHGAEIAFPTSTIHIDGNPLNQTSEPPEM